MQKEKVGHLEDAHRDLNLLCCMALLLWSSSCCGVQPYYNPLSYEGNTKPLSVRLCF